MTIIITTKNLTLIHNSNTILITKGTTVSDEVHPPNVTRLGDCSRSNFRVPG